MNVKPKTMFTGDNLPIMRGMDTESVDLIYLDPPFNSKKQWSAPISSEAAGAAFKDTWTLNDIDVADLGILAEERPKLANLINSIGDVNGSGDKSYLLMMASRLIEMHRILKPTGSIYLHCDPTMSHSLKLLMDCIFGRGNFRNEVVWRKYGGRKNNAKYKFTTQNDNILFYGVSTNAKFNGFMLPHSDKEIEKEYKHTDLHGKRYRLSRGRNYQKTGVQKRIYLDESPGRAAGNLWVEDGLQLNTSSKERVGYPTQKPLKLLERIIKASSSEGDTVLDPFCGCATACLAAESLNRNWIGIDLSGKAIELVKLRFKNELGLFNPNIIHRTDIPKRSDGVFRSKDIKHTLYGKQEGLCNGCRSYFEYRNFEVDHVVPKASGGPDDDGNLQLLCGSCNRIKGRRTMGYLHTVLEKRGL